MSHTPVLLGESIDALRVRPGGTYADGTFGGGGYSREILSRGGSVIALDRDASAAPAARVLSEEYGARFEFYNERFSRMAEMLDGRKIDGLVLDLGVSSMQIDEAERGFSYMRDGPLLMAMGLNRTDAFEIVNGYPPEKIADIIYRYGEEPKSRQIARAIAAARPIATTLNLAATIRKTAGERAVPRVFQAIRIAVNGELDELDSILAASADMLNPGGRLAVVSFHSLEDRMVKDFMRGGPASTHASRYVPESAPGASFPFKQVGKNAIMPSEAEARANPRAASAKLRVAERI
ncbi:MAG: 16S rRNA (cytosine(1402)-N(4))-methyltransferase RsmH [Rickettsiales bacterium]|jgi:16S rRNA (cytosine1402-N4)-methyltransferase|nr:16S rRNA (cytosine(1402)-N(4))-methyltransferase RsmH [Rickettsiales bacterium]